MKRELLFIFQVRSDMGQFEGEKKALILNDTIIAIAHRHILPAGETDFLLSL